MNNPRQTAKNTRPTMGLGVRLNSFRFSEVCSDIFLVFCVGFLFLAKALTLSYYPAIKYQPFSQGVQGLLNKKYILF